MPPLFHQRAGDLLAGLNGPVRAALVASARLAAAGDATLWLVGGVVRDLLLGLPVERDVDLAVEGDAVALAHAIAAALGGQVAAVHDAFGTATLLVAADAAEPLTLDLARTRVETYPHPAALPLVEPATIAQDLRRRDFSINAIALEVRAAGATLQPGRLLDPFGGRADLAAGLLRVLHAASFDDDPTRLLRGLRLAARLDLRAEPHTAALRDAALVQGRLEATSPDRVRAELCLALAEPRPDAVLRLADEWGLTPHIYPSLHWSEALAARCRRLEQATAFQNDGSAPLGQPASLIAHLYLGLLTYDLTAAERADLAARYRAPADAARLLRDVGAARATLPDLLLTLRNSDLDRLLHPFSKMALSVVHYAESPPISTIVGRYLADMYDVKPLLDGYALQQLGVAPGPHLGRLLRELRAARLDGLVTTREDEVAWVVARTAV